MSISRFIQKPQEAIVAAEKLTNQNDNQQIDEERLFSALLTVSDFLIVDPVAKMGIQKGAFFDESEAPIQKFPKVSGGDREYVSADLNRALNGAEDETKATRDDYVFVEHLFLSLLKNPNRALRKLFRTYGITREKSLQALSTVRGNRRITSDSPKATYDTPNKYGYGLIERAQDRELDPVIDGSGEIRNTIRALSRKIKNNPVLIGEPGVGKTAVVEGLVQRIVRGDVSEGLKDKRPSTPDMDVLVTGARYHDELEERLKAALEEVRKSEGEVILFIDELHMIMDTGTSEGNMDAGNTLRPMLAYGELHCINATILDEYRKYIEKDPAFERRFQPILVDQLTVRDTVSILRGLKERYENYHHVKIQDGALISATVLPDRYITDRLLPDRTIDLVDEACVMIKTELDSLSAELDEMNRRRMQFEIEATVPWKKIDNLLKERLKAIEKELAGKKAAFAEAKAKWENEKASISRLAEIRQQIEDTNHEIRAARQAYSLNKAAELQYGRPPELQKWLTAEEVKVQGQDSSFMRRAVIENKIAKIISHWTNIPVAKLTESEKSRTLHLDDILHQRIIDQDETVEKVAETIQRNRAGIKDPPRPTDFFLLFSLTGVGKTELAKSFVMALLDDEGAMVRLDVSEYMEKLSVSRLIGVSPGYVGYDEGDQLTEVVKRKPYSAVLFNEVGKTHLDVFNVPLQALDDSHITDSSGKTVDFKNTIIIMTSNLSFRYLLDGIDKQDNIKPEAVAAVDIDVKVHFHPEFLDHLDKIITFRPLTRQNIGSTMDLLLQETNERLADQEISIEPTPAARQYVANEGYGPTFGARPLKRFLQKHVKILVAKLILSSNSGLHKGAVVQMDVDKKKGDSKVGVVA